LNVVVAATAVAWELYQIFTTQGCPLILQHDNGKEFVNKIVRRVKALWPDSLIVRGRPRHPQTQGSVERGNQDVHRLVGHWMKNYNSNRWSIGIYTVAMEKNNRFHRTINASPYELLFGQKPRIRMLELPYDLELVKKMSTEAELENLLGVETFFGVENEEEETEDEIEEEGDAEETIPGLIENIHLLSVKDVIVFENDGGNALLKLSVCTKAFFIFKISKKLFMHAKSSIYYWVVEKAFYACKKLIALLGSRKSFLHMQKAHSIIVFFIKLILSV